MSEVVVYLSKSNKQTEMNNVTTTQAISLINRAYDANGFLINPKSKKNQNEARAILESDLNLYGKTVNGFDAHVCMLVIAYPDQAI